MLFKLNNGVFFSVNVFNDSNGKCENLCIIKWLILMESL